MPGGPYLGSEVELPPLSWVSTLCPPPEENGSPQEESSRWTQPRALRGHWGRLGAGQGLGWGGPGAAGPAVVVARGVHSPVSCLLYFSGSSPPPPALLLPRVWPWAVPTYGPYGRFCSQSARLSCTPVLAPVTSMRLSLAPSLCPHLFPHRPRWVAEPRAPACPRATLQRACLLLSWSLVVLEKNLCGLGRSAY